MDSLSLGTPGISAQSVMPWASSQTSTAGTTDAGVSPLSSGSVVSESLLAMIVPRLLNGDFPRLGDLLARNTDLQDAVAEARIHGTFVRILGQGDHAAKASREALIDMNGLIVRILLPFYAALSGDDQHA